MRKLVRSPETAELRAFCAAVDLGSLGRAARLLQVSQPAVSKRIRAFENLVGARLLERSPRGVKATSAGARLYGEARKLLAEMDNVEALITGLASDEVPIRLAASHTMAEFALPSPLVEFETLHDRHLCVELFIANSRFVRRLVRDGHAELGLAAVDPVEGPDKVLKESRFCEDEVVVAVPTGHPWGEGAEIEVEDLLGTPMVMRDPGANSRRVVESVLADKGLSLTTPLAEVGSTSAAKRLALENGAPVLLAQLALRDSSEGFAVCGVRGLRFPRKFVVVSAGEQKLSKGARALLDHLLDRSPKSPA